MKLNILLYLVTASNGDALKQEHLYEPGTFWQEAWRPQELRSMHSSTSEMKKN